MEPSRFIICVFQPLRTVLSLFGVLLSWRILLVLSGCDPSSGIKADGEGVDGAGEGRGVSLIVVIRSWESEY